MNLALPSKPLPLYLQISELLSREILAGHWQPGERIPTEPELSASLGVSVGTLRKAVAELEQRGALERKQGSGTYVRASGKVRHIYEFFRLELLEGGGLPTAQLLDVSLQPLPDGVRFTQSPRGRNGWRIRRLRLLGSVAVAVEEIWIDARHKRNLKAQDLSDSLYLFYHQQLKFWIARVTDHIGFAPLPSWAVTALSAKPGVPCTLVERQAWSNSNAVEEYSRTWVHPERARYVARWQ